MARIIQRALAVCQEENGRIREAVARLPDCFLPPLGGPLIRISLSAHFPSMQHIETTATMQGIVQRGKTGGKQGEQGETYSHPFGRGLLLNSSGLLPDGAMNTLTRLYGKKVLRISRE